jgi:hypothetical protein
MAHLTCKQHGRRVLVITSPDDSSKARVVHRTQTIELRDPCNTQMVLIGGLEFTPMRVLDFENSKRPNHVASDLLPTSTKVPETQLLEAIFTKPAGDFVEPEWAQSDPRS